MLDHFSISVVAFFLVRLNTALVISAGVDACVNFVGYGNRDQDEFVQRMKEKGYSERQVRRLVEWYMRVNKAG